MGRSEQPFEMDQCVPEWNGVTHDFLDLVFSIRVFRHQVSERLMVRTSVLAGLREFSTESRILALEFFQSQLHQSRIRFAGFAERSVAGGDRSFIEIRHRMTSKGVAFK